MKQIITQLDLTNLEGFQFNQLTLMKQIITQLDQMISLMLCYWTDCLKSISNDNWFSFLDFRAAGGGAVELRAKNGAIALGK